MALTSKLTIKAEETYSKTIGVATANFPLVFQKLISLADGTTADKADKLYHATRTLSASTSEDLDLAGSLLDPFGDTLTFARIKGLIVAAAAANTNNVVVGGAASNIFINWVSDATDKVVVRPGGVFGIIAPDVTAYAVTAGTGDLLRVANSGAGSSVTYDIVIVGSSA
jgi:hypothetical protein